MYIPTIVIICMICGGIGGTLGYYLTKKNVNVNIKMYKSDKIKMYNYSKLT